VSRSSHYLPKTSLSPIIEWLYSIEMPDAALDKRSKQPVFADTIEAVEMGVAAQMHTEASASLPGTFISPQ